MQSDALRIIHKTRQDYNLIARYFSDTRHDLWPELEEFKKLIKDGQNILDWGCGNGRLVFLLEDKKVHYFGTDQSDELLKIAKKKFSKQIKECRVKFFSTARKKKSFPANFFDLIFMIASFHHLPDKQSRQELLNDVYKELNPSGKLIITVWNLESDWAKNKTDSQWKKIGANDFLIPWKNPQGELVTDRYYHHFSKEELGGLLEEAGFKIERLDYGEKTNWTDKKGGRNLVAVVTK